MRLHPWTGAQVAFLTTRTNLDGAVMRRIVERLDAGWALYADLTGRRPRPFKQLAGMPVIAAVPDSGLTCGYGCGYVGLTGIELGGFYEHDYPLVAGNRNASPHYWFYEMGRNFYTFGDRHSQFITGCAVFMRYVCMDALGCHDPDRATRQTIEDAEVLYAHSDLEFLRAFTTVAGLDEKAPRLKRANGRALHPSDQPVLYASAMLKLRRDHGGDAWVKRFFAQLAACPEIQADTPQGALRQSLNWLVAASCAARRDLSDVFVDRWRMPLSRPTREALSRVPWDGPDADAAAVLDQLTAATPSP